MQQTGTESMLLEGKEKILNWKQMGNVERGKVITELQILGMRVGEIAKLVGVDPKRVTQAREAYESFLGKQKLKEIFGR